MKSLQKALITGIVGVLFLSACGSFTPQVTATPEPTATFTPPPPTATPTFTPTPIPPTPTPIRTPPVLPGVFQSSLLNPLDTPHTYIKDTCQYLKMKWDPNNSAPGTVVMIIMYHSITDGPPPYKDNQIHQDYHQLTMQHAADKGFMTINTTQLIEFLEHNAKIPSRSLLLLSDDRHNAEFFTTHFTPIIKKHNWTSVTVAWISTVDNSLIKFGPLRKLVDQGILDMQAHGVDNFMIDESWSDENIRRELEGSIIGLQEHFDTTPIAYIWPMGGFSKRAIEIARELGYRMGFTTNPRGPVMFNWVPLIDKKDPMRPYWYAEGSMNDPLMVLPRYWDTDADFHLDEVINIGDAAAAEAAANRDTELLYYDIMCSETLGPIPAP